MIPTEERVTRLRFRCVACDRITSGKKPTGGNGTFMFPRFHKNKSGEKCPGCFQEAEWVQQTLIPKTSKWVESESL